MWFFVACSDPPDSPAETGKTADSETDLVTETGDSPVDTGDSDSVPPDTETDSGEDSVPPEPATILDLRFEAAAAISTVGTATWSTNYPATAWIEYGEDEGFGHSTLVDTSLTTEHRIVLVGVPADSTWAWRAASQTEAGEVFYSETQSFSTGPTDDWVPEMTLELDSAEAASGGYISTSILTDSDESVLLLLDEDARPVWWMKADSNVSLPRVRISKDGASVLYDGCVSVDDGDGTCKIHRVSFDQTQVESYPALGIHHDYVEMDDGGYAWLAKNTRTIDVDGTDTIVTGDDLDVGNGTGDDVDQVWSSWDEMDPDISAPDSWNGSSYDWTHCNSIQKIDAPAGWVLSCKLIDAVLFIGATGGIHAQIGGTAGTMELASGTASYHQHYAIWEGDEHSGELSMFDNQVLLGDARAVTYQVDFDSNLYEEAWSWAPEEDVFADGRGSVVSVGDLRLIAWGSAYFVNQVNEAGDEVWRMDAGTGHTLGYTEWVDQLGGPAAAPVPPEDTGGPDTGDPDPDSGDTGDTGP